MLHKCISASKERVLIMWVPLLINFFVCGKNDSFINTFVLRSVILSACLFEIFFFFCGKSCLKINLSATPGE